MHAPNGLLDPTAAAPLPGPAPALATPPGFAQRHAWDRIFHPLAVAVIWAVILRGFVPEIIGHQARGEPAYLPLIHVHAAAFVGWLVLLTAQVALIRARRADLHRTLGTLGAALAAAMVVLGPWAGIVAEQVHFGTPEGDPPFLAIEFLQMIAFGLQVLLAVRLRRDGAAHKRLMLLATLFLTTAGFGRFAYAPLHHLLGDGMLPYLVEFYGGSILLVLGTGLYDLVTRGRLHPAYVAGAGIGFAGEVLAAWLYYEPAWQAAALKIIGH